MKRRPTMTRCQRRTLVIARLMQVERVSLRDVQKLVACRRGTAAQLMREMEWDGQVQQVIGYGGHPAWILSSAWTQSGRNQADCTLPGSVSKLETVSMVDLSDAHRSAVSTLADAWVDQHRSTWDSLSSVDRIFVLCSIRCNHAAILLDGELRDAVAAPDLERHLSVVRTGGFLN